MGNEFTGFEDNAPTLTLEPDLGEPKAEVAAEPEAEAVKKEMEQTVLSPEEQQMVDSFAKKIDIENTNQILQYGAGTQKSVFGKRCGKFFANHVLSHGIILWIAYLWNKTSVEKTYSSHAASEAEQVRTGYHKL